MQNLGINCNTRWDLKLTNHVANNLTYFNPFICISRGHDARILDNCGYAKKKQDMSLNQSTSILLAPEQLMKD
jgi:hypothetical protein